MRKHSFTGLIATGLIAIITLNFTYSVEECPAADITVQLDQPVYVVNGPGDSIIAQILIDGDSNKEGLQPVDHGLFSAGLKITFDERKAAVNSPSDVTVQRELNYFGFGAPALVATTPSGVFTCRLTFASTRRLPSCILQSETPRYVSSSFSSVRYALASAGELMSG